MGSFAIRESRIRILTGHFSREKEFPAQQTREPCRFAGAPVFRDAGPIVII
jgi:hypothetical protein